MSTVRIKCPNEHLERTRFWKRIRGSRTFKVNWILAILWNTWSLSQAEELLLFLPLFCRLKRCKSLFSPTYSTLYHPQGFNNWFLCAYCDQTCFIATLIYVTGFERHIDNQWSPHGLQSHKHKVMTTPSDFLERKLKQSSLLKLHIKQVNFSKWHYSKQWILIQWDKDSWGQKHQLYKNVLRDAWMYYLETFNLSLRPYCPSLHYQSISNILFGYEHLGMTRGWFIIYSKASRKLFHSKPQGKWISLLLSPRNYLSSIFQLKVKKWKKAAQSSIMFSPLSYCKRLCSLHSCVSTSLRLVSLVEMWKIILQI